MLTREEMLGYRCPRWNDWPNIELYMDQVTGLLETYVAGFYPDDQPNSVTSTMINNYVKQKIIHPSKNKKYSRAHLAHLYILFLLKPVLSLTEISNGIACLTEEEPIEARYDFFCDEIQAAIGRAFGDEKQRQADLPGEGGVIRAMAQAFSYNMLAKCCLQAEMEAKKLKEQKE